MKNTKNVFISGANRGVGLALAEVFLRLDWRVFAGHRSPPTGEFSELLQQYPHLLTPVILDVSQADSIRQAVQQIAGQVEALDALVNNAAVYLEDQQLTLETLDLDDGRLEKTLDVNANGPLRLTQACLPLLHKGLRKLLVNISSEAGGIGDCWRSNEFAYCMSKAALNIQTKILNNYLTPAGFTVLAIHPGWVRTEMGGPEADISPEESTQGILDVILREWKEGDPIFWDYRGQALGW